MTKTNHSYPQLQPCPYPESIDAEALASLPKAQCPVPIHLIETGGASINKLVRALRDRDAIGIDTETKPSFVPGKRTEVSLLQIATDEECFLVRLNRVGLPDPLAEVLAREDLLKIGLSLQGDITALRRLNAFEPRGFLELQHLCPAYGLRKAASLQKIYAIIFGEYMSKSQRMSNWNARQLTTAQQHYAALDAWASLRVYRHLMELPHPHPVQFALL